jgi:hypothetical protein
MAGIYLNKNVTERQPDGTLTCKYGIKDVLLHTLSKLDIKRKERVIDKILAPVKFVPYRPHLLDEPVLDDKLADRTACMWNFADKIKICYPDTVNYVNSYKHRPIRAASRYGMQKNMAYFVAKSIDAETRFMTYVVFNSASRMDRDLGTDSFIKLLDLFTALTDKDEIRADILKDLFIEENWCNYNPRVFRKYLDLWLLLFGREQVKKVSGTVLRGLVIS